MKKRLMKAGLLLGAVALAVTYVPKLLIRDQLLSIHWAVIALRAGIAVLILAMLLLLISLAMKAEES